MAFPSRIPQPAALAPPVQNQFVSASAFQPSSPVMNSGGMNTSNLNSSLSVPHSIGQSSPSQAQMSNIAHPVSSPVLPPPGSSVNPLHCPSNIQPPIHRNSPSPAPSRTPTPHHTPPGVGTPQTSIPSEPTMSSTASLPQMPLQNSESPTPPPPQAPPSLPVSASVIPV
ncbi:unnamed protein product, partial [Ranitomeya imitator]